jgi:acetoin utilization deacetylase AcuC-like enzyme
MQTAYISHPSFLKHDMGDDHPECPRRVSIIADQLLAHGLLDLMDCIDAPAASVEQLCRAHDAAHVAKLIEASQIAEQRGHVQLDPDTAMNAHTLTAALHAAGAAVRAAELVAGGQHQRAFCNVRPPGHHAERQAAMGFCFFNNVAVGIRHALDALGMERVALIDFDVHHGNGSESILANDPRVLMLSTFETRLYPFSGDEPLGSNMVNVPLAPYSDGRALREAVTERWLPAMQAFKPHLVFVSAGFDAHREDDISHLCWSDADYAWLSGQIVAFADACCGGRIVSILEGGYSLPSLARCSELHVKSLLGLD